MNIWFKSFAENINCFINSIKMEIRPLKELSN